jgi:phage-related holin
MHVRQTVHKTMVILTYLIVTLLNTESWWHFSTVFFFLHFIEYHYISENLDLQNLCTGQQYLDLLPFVNISYSSTFCPSLLEVVYICALLEAEFVCV